MATKLVNGRKVQMTPEEEARRVKDREDNIVSHRELQDEKDEADAAMAKLETATNLTPLEIKMIFKHPPTRR